MKLKGGLRTDERFVDVPDGSWVDARNILLQKGFQSISNENGNTVTHLLDGQLINGVIPTSKDTSVIFSVGTGFSQIGILSSTGTYTTIIHDSQSLFNFSMLNPIEGVFKYNYKGDLIVAWCDGINSTSQVPKLLNLTDLPFDVDGSYELVTPTDIVLSYLFPNVKTPTITVDKVNNNGGSLKAGVHYFAIAYEIQDNDLTNFLQVSRPVTVASIVKTTTTPSISDITPFIYNDKAPGIVTSVSIDLTISNLDTTFQFFRLITISKLNGVITTQEIGRFSTLSGTITYTHTGRENYTTLNIANILVNNIAFIKAKTMTDFQSSLYVGNTKVNNIKYQKFANNIGIKYSITNIPVTAPNTVIFEDLRDCVLYKSYQPEEVYGLYIHLILKNGTVTEGFHIPGRDARPLRKILDRNVTYTSWINNAGNIEITTTNSLNLSSLGNFVVIIINGTEYNVTSYQPTLIVLDGYGGTFAEAASGTLNAYSNNNADSSEMENSLTTGSPFVTTEEQSLDVNLKFHQINDTADEPDSNYQGLMGYWENENETYPNEDEYNGALDYNNVVISGGRDLRGTKVKHHKMPSQNRINKNSSTFDALVIGIRFDNVVIPADIESKVQGFYISYIKRDFNNMTILANDILLKKYQNADSSNYANMYNFALLVSKPALNPSYLRHIYTIDSNFTILNYAEFAGITTLGQTLTVSSLEYHSDNNSATIPDNTDRVENISLKYVNTLPSESASPPLGTSFATSRDFNTSICIANLCNYVKDLYTSFYAQQELCSTGKIYYTDGSGLYSIYNTTTVDILFGGDTFLNDVHAKTDKQVSPYFLIMPYLCYSNYNIGVREKDVSLWSSYYGNHYEYNKDFSSLLDLKQTSSFNTYLPILNTFPFRVNKSNVANDESLSLGWRIFPPNSYKEINKNKGEVWSLNKLDKELLIQAKYTLYIVKIRDRLNTDGQETYLGVNDIFDREPDEVVSNQFGYVGSQSQWASFVCKIGYVCFDREQGKIFIYNGKLSEISDNGNRNFFKNKLNTSVNVDNPFYIYAGGAGTTGGGITAAYDEKNERIIFCKKDVSDSSLSLTMSYSIRDNIWICKHNYFPNHIFSTRNKLYFIQNVIGTTNKGRIIEHNVGNKGEFWNQTSYFKYDTYIDVIFKQPNVISKIFDSVNWKSEIINSSGVNLKNKTITNIMVYNSTQCSGVIDINTNTGAWFSPNCTNVQETWKFNNFKDVVKDKTLPFLDSNNQVLTSNINNNKNWFDKSLFIDKFVIVRFIYDNEDNNDIYISDVDVTDRQSNE